MTTHHTTADARTAVDHTDAIDAYLDALIAIRAVGYDSTGGAGYNRRRRRDIAENATHDTIRDSERDDLIHEVYDTIEYGTHTRRTTLESTLERVVAELDRIESTDDSDDDDPTPATNMVRVRGRDADTVREGDRITVYYESTQGSRQTLTGTLTNAAPGEWEPDTLIYEVESDAGKARTFSYTMGEDDQIATLHSGERPGDHALHAIGDIMGVVVRAADEQDSDDDDTATLDRLADVAAAVDEGDRVAVEYERPTDRFGNTRTETVAGDVHRTKDRDSYGTREVEVVFAGDDGQNYAVTVRDSSPDHPVVRAWSGTFKTGDRRHGTTVSQDGAVAVRVASAASEPDSDDGGDGQDSDESAASDAERGAEYDADRTDGHGNDPQYAPLGARDDGSPCGACGEGTLQFAGGAPLPGWMGTPDGEREVYTCDTCGADGTLAQREGQSVQQSGACAPPEPTAAVDGAATPDGGRVDPHDGEDRADYLANQAERRL